MKRVELRIYGEVQGVGFRFFAEAQAQKTRVTGFAQNRPDGTIQVVAEGEEKNIVEFVKLVSRGPAFAKVTRVIKASPPARGEFIGFRVR